MVNNHGDRFRPLTWGCSWVQMASNGLWGGDPKYLLTGMILPVTVVQIMFQVVIPDPKYMRKSWW